MGDECGAGRNDMLCEDDEDEDEDDGMVCCVSYCSIDKHEWVYVCMYVWMDGWMNNLNCTNTRNLVRSGRFSHVDEMMKK